MRDESYTPFAKRPDRPPPETITVFVMARTRGEQTDSMRGSLRPSAHGCDAAYLLNRELYRTQWWASEARADPAAHRDALAPPAGARSVPAVLFVSRCASLPNATAAQHGASSGWLPPIAAGRRSWGPSGASWTASGTRW